MKSKASLKAQLTDYSKAVFAQLERPGNAAGIKNWVSYSAAAASAFAAVAAADAGVIYSGIRNIVSGPNIDGPTSKPVDIDGDGSIEFKITGFERAGSYGVGEIGAIDGRVDAVLVSSDFDGDAVRFMTSESVGPKGRFVPGKVRLATNTTQGNTYGEFQNSEIGFAGFRFNPGDGDHYGWIRLRLEDLSVDKNGLIDTLTAVDWAYESEIDTPIRAGNKGTAVPEPSSLTIVGLAMGCGALSALRRRRQLQKAAANQAKG